MMHPGFHWWRARHGGADLGAWAAHWGCGPSFAERVWAERRASGERYGDFAGGAFGVRRPLRFLAFKLDLDERQVAELAKILSELKTERAQAEVDSRRTLAGLAKSVRRLAKRDPKMAEQFREGSYYTRERAAREPRRVRRSAALQARCVSVTPNESISKSCWATSAGCHFQAHFRLTG